MPGWVLGPTVAVPQSDGPQGVSMVPGPLGTGWLCPQGRRHLTQGLRRAVLTCKAAPRLSLGFPSTWLRQHPPQGPLLQPHPGRGPWPRRVVVSASVLGAPAFFSRLPGAYGLSALVSAIVGSADASYS